MNNLNNDCSSKYINKRYVFSEKVYDTYDCSTCIFNSLIYFNTKTTKD